MKGVLIIAVTAALAASAWASPPQYEYAGKWGSPGSGNGQFSYPCGVAVASSGNVYVGDSFNHRIQYFTSTGSFLGAWGGGGTGNGQFNHPDYVAVTPNGAYVYVADNYNHRIQYFDQTNPTVEPTSLGRVKALFR